MDKGLSRSMPYLPRYHSASPARSPRLDNRRVLSLRSVSQPKQRIMYVDNEPMRVLNSYPSHHSPSPHRRRVCHLLTSKPNQHLVRKSRSLSEHDLLASHVYASQEDLGVKAVTEAVRRQVGSCEDIYHKGPYFPDRTASESGVSVLGSEEGSMFDLEDDLMSQNSFGSSSAFFEVTMDSELDRLDSDATHSGTESGHLGDRTLNVLYEDDLDERGGHRRSVRGHGRDLHSPDSNRSSPLSYGESRRRELMSSPSWDFDKLQSRFQALKVTIPGHDPTSIMKSPRDQRKSVGDKGVIPSTPLAQSTPHVSPRGFGEPRLSIKATWNVDDPDIDDVGVLDKSGMEKSRAARALFQADVSDCESRLSSRAADSSCNTSFSEDNLSDVSSLTVSSAASAPRKTKKVKKPSDLPASARANSNSNNAVTASSTTSVMRVDTGPEVLAPKSASVSGSEFVETQSGQLSEENKTGLDGNEWWAVYNIGSAKAREAEKTEGDAKSNEEGQEGDEEDPNSPSSTRRNIRVVKPIKVTIPLISAGKHGQEKLKRLSQTSPPSSSPNTPRLSPRHESQLSPGVGTEEHESTRHGNTDWDQSQMTGVDMARAIMKFDKSESPISREKDAEQEEDEANSVFLYPERTLSSAFSTGDDEEEQVADVCDKHRHAYPGKEATLGVMLAGNSSGEVGRRDIISSSDRTQFNHSCKNIGEIGSQGSQGAQLQIDVDGDRESVRSNAPYQSTPRSTDAEVSSCINQSNNHGIGQDELTTEIAGMRGGEREVGEYTRTTQVKDLGGNSCESTSSPASDQRGGVREGGGHSEAGRVAGGGEVDGLSGQRAHYELGNAGQREEDEEDGRWGGRGVTLSTGLPEEEEGTQVWGEACGVRIGGIPDLPGRAGSHLVSGTSGEKIDLTTGERASALVSVGSTGVGDLKENRGQFKGDVFSFLTGFPDVNTDKEGEAVVSTSVFTARSEICGFPADYERADVSGSEQGDGPGEVNKSSVNSLEDSRAARGQVAGGCPEQGQVRVGLTSPAATSGHVTENNDHSLDSLQKQQQQQQERNLEVCFSCLSLDDHQADLRVERGEEGEGKEEEGEEKEITQLEKMQINNGATRVSLTASAARARAAIDDYRETPPPPQLTQPTTWRVFASAQKPRGDASGGGVLVTRGEDDISCASAFTSPTRGCKSQNGRGVSFPHSQDSIGVRDGEFIASSPHAERCNLVYPESEREADSSLNLSHNISGSGGRSNNHQNTVNSSGSGFAVAPDSERDCSFRSVESGTTRDRDQLSAQCREESIEQSGVTGGYGKGTTPQAVRWNNEDKQHQFGSENSTQFSEVKEENPQVSDAQVTSKRVKHVHRKTVETITTTERIVNQSPPNASTLSGGDTNSGSVDIVTNRSTTETIIKEDDDYFSTTTSSVYPNPNTDSGHASTTGDNNGDGCHHAGGKSPIHVSVKSPRDSSQATPISTARSASEDTPSRVSHTSQHTSHAPSRVTAHGDEISHHVTGVEESGASRCCEDKNNDTRARSDLRTPGADTAVAAGEETAYISTPAGGNNNATAEMTTSFPRPNTGRPVMRPSDSLLDSLEAELSRLSSDLSTLRSEVVGDEDRTTQSQHGVYRDHAEATSVLKHIVRGDDQDFSTSVSNNSGTVVVKSYRGNAFPLELGEDEESFLTGESVRSAGTGGAREEHGGQGRSEREHYDNDYDYVTTNLPKSSNRHHHMQRLKPGQLKASSLWTLQEETESVIDVNSPKSSPKRTLATVASEDENSSEKTSECPSPSEERRGLRVHTGDGEWSPDENDNIKLPRGLNTGLEEKRQFACESSDFEESDGNYSSISTTESASHWSSSIGREQTPLSDQEISPRGGAEEIMDYQEMEEGISPRSDRISSFQEFVTGLHSSHVTPGWPGNARNFSITQQDAGNQIRSPRDTDHHRDTSAANTFKSSVAFSIHRPENRNNNSMSVLDNLSASLEQFATPEFWGTTTKELSLENEWSSNTYQQLSSSKDVPSLTLLNSSDLSQDLQDTSASTIHEWHEADSSLGEGSSRLHALDLDLSRISSCPSPVPSDLSESSQYTCTGTAEVKRVTRVRFSGDYDIPVPTSTPKDKVKVALRRPGNAANELKRKHEEENVKKFDKLLTEFDKQCKSEALNDLVFLEEKRVDNAETTDAGDLYKAFTNEDAEKKQNNVCIVVEDENMGTFRFKRFLKKSHTKRNKKGRKVMRFLSRLNCVSETVHSPDMSANRKQIGGDMYSVDSMSSPKHRKISSPILLTSTSFHHFQEFSPSVSPQNSPTKSTPSSSNQSLDSLRSRTDSAYSSVSESALGSVSSPVATRQHRVSSSVFSSTSVSDGGHLRVPAPSTGSVSSVFHSDVTSHPADRSLSDSAYSTASDVTTSRSYSEADFSNTDATLLASSPLPVDPSGKRLDYDMLSALSDVFDQLDVCEGEIDSALLNRLRYGHTEVHGQQK